MLKGKKDLIFAICIEPCCPNTKPVFGMLLSPRYENNLRYNTMINSRVNTIKNFSKSRNQGCGVARSGMFFGWSRSRIPENPRSRIFYSTPEVQMATNKIWFKLYTGFACIQDVAIRNDVGWMQKWIWAKYRNWDEDAWGDGTSEAWPESFYWHFKHFLRSTCSAEVRKPYRAVKLAKILEAALLCLIVNELAEIARTPVKVFGRLCKEMPVLAVFLTHVDLSDATVEPLVGRRESVFEMGWWDLFRGVIRSFRGHSRLFCHQKVSLNFGLRVDQWSPTLLAPAPLRKILLWPRTPYNL